MVWTGKIWLFGGKIGSFVLNGKLLDHLVYFDKLWNSIIHVLINYDYLVYTV